MPISLTCTCGRVFRVKDTAAGKKVRCPACDLILNIPLPPTEPKEDDEALNLLLEDSSPPRAPSPPPLPAPSITSAPRDRHPAPIMPASRPPQTNYSPRVKKPRRADREDHGPGWLANANNGSTVSGFLMMLGAVVWFVLGWMAGRIFFYPPILFVLGFISFAKGLMGQDD